MKNNGNCEICSNYVYDEELDCYCCDINLDEDEMSGFITGNTVACPYFCSDDEYKIVRKQN